VKRAVLEHDMIRVLGKDESAGSNPASGFLPLLCPVVIGLSVSETKTMFKERVPGVLRHTSSTSCDSVAKRWTRLDNINVAQFTKIVNQHRGGIRW
jgi:hypothetical protein